MFCQLSLKLPKSPQLTRKSTAMGQSDKGSEDAESSLVSMVNAVVDWFDDVLYALGLGSGREPVQDLLILSVVPVVPTPELSLVLSAIDFHPFSWLALGIMILSSQAIGSRAQRYEGQNLAKQELVLHSSRVLLISSVVQATLCGLEYAQLMTPLATFLGISSPFLVARFFQDALILPYWITCVGKSMRQPQQATRLTYNYSVVGNLLQMAAVWCDDTSFYFLVPAALCLGSASYRILQFEAEGSEGLDVSKVDLKSSSHLLVFYLLSGFIVETLGVSHEIGQEQMLVEYAVLDVVGKVPSCHMLTRSLAGANFELNNTMDVAALDFEHEDSHKLFGNSTW